MSTDAQDETPTVEASAVEESLRVFVEQVEDYAMYVVDRAGRVASWNIGAQRLKGYSAEEIIGKPLSTFYRREDLPKCALELETARRTGRYEDEGWRVRKDGSRFWANVVLTALRDPHGELIGFAKVTRDLTERRKAEEERLRAAEQKAARESAERIVALLTGVNRLLAALAAAATPDEVVRVLVAEAARTVHAEQALFARSGDAGQPPFVLTARQSRAPQWIEEGHDSPGGAAVALPLACADGVAGVLVFRFAAGRAIPAEERVLVETFAAQAAQALERAESHAKEVATRRRLQAIGDLSASLATALRVHDVVAAVVDRGMDAFGSDTCTLYRLDHSTGALHLVAERGCSPTLLPLIQTITPASQNPVYRTLATGESLWVESAAEYRAMFPALATMKAEGPRACAFWSAPMFAEGRPIGLLAMGFYQPREFPAVERTFVATFIRHCAEALRRAQLLDAEQSARATVERLRASLYATLHSIGDAVIATDAAGVITLMNPVAESLTGWPESDARGLPLGEVFRIVNEHTREVVTSPVEKVLELGVVVGLANHTVLIARDGRECPIDDSGSPIRGATGEIEGVVLVFRDVREKKREESRAAFLAEASTVLGESIDYQRTLTRVTELAVPRLADWCALDLVVTGEPLPTRLSVAHVDPAKVQLAKDLSAKYPPDPNAPNGVPNVLRTGTSELYADIPDELLVRASVDAEHLRIARELQLRSAMIVPLAASGRILGAMSFVFAESGRAYAHEDLRMAEELARRCATAIDNAALYASEQQARRTAEIANHAKDEFLATVSHELRTPLTAILGWAKMLSSANLDETRRRRAIETVDRNAVAMAQLIDDLLDMSRIISGKMRLDAHEIDARDVAEAALESVKLAAELKGIESALRLPDGVPKLVGDPARLQQVIWNLLTNAVKFTPPGGRVEVAVRSSGSHVEILVTDTGKGIAPEFLPYVFDAFRQEDRGHTRARAGLGLGLAIARQLVELHSGHISAHSEGEGRGATFIVRVPVSPVRSSSRPPPPRESQKRTPFSSPPQLRGLRILLVDDEDDARHLIQSILEQCGCVVTAVGSVPEAMSALAEGASDIILSDIGMPELDGYELIRRVRALPPDRGGDAPAAALTAYTRPEDRQRVLNAGYSTHIAKPVEPAELVAVVASLTRFVHRARS